MAGILLVTLVAIWLAFAVWASGRISEKSAAIRWKLPLRGLVLAGLTVLPVADEVLGRFQFAELCEKYTAIQISEMRTAGRTVYLADLPDVRVTDGLLPITSKPWHFVDVDTRTTLVSYNTLMADGGWLARTLHLSQGDVPLTFHGYCRDPRADPVRLLRELNLKQIQRAQVAPKD
jgi:hypothetical protein